MFMYRLACLFHCFFLSLLFLLFFFNDPAPTEIYTLSLHDALPIFDRAGVLVGERAGRLAVALRSTSCGLASTVPIGSGSRSEEHTSELQSHSDLVCRLLLEKKKHDLRNTGRTDVQGIPEQAVADD